MIKFEYIINNYYVAKQIATMLNKYNKLQKFHTEYSILNSNVSYIINQEYINNTFIINGCIGTQTIDNDTTIIRHLCVDERYRRKKIAENLLITAISKINTKYVSMHIRHTNMPSLTLASKFGFTIASYYQTDNYFILIVKKENYITNGKIY